MYDYLDSFEDPDVSFKLSQESITLLALVGFILNKFISNVTKVNKELNPPKSAPQQESTKIVTCVYNFSHFFWSELGPYRRQFGRKPWCQP